MLPPSKLSNHKIISVCNYVIMFAVLNAVPPESMANSKGQRRSLFTLLLILFVALPVAHSWFFSSSSDPDGTTTTVDAEPEDELHDTEVHRSAKQFAGWIIVPATIVFALLSVFNGMIGHGRGYVVCLLGTYVIWQALQLSGVFGAAVIIRAREANCSGRACKFATAKVRFTSDEEFKHDLGCLMRRPVNQIYVLQCDASALGRATSCIRKRLKGLCSCLVNAPHLESDGMLILCQRPVRRRQCIAPHARE